MHKFPKYKTNFFAIYESRSTAALLYLQREWNDMAYRRELEGENSRKKGTPYVFGGGGLKK
jgi:hypothetical protein